MTDEIVFVLLVGGLVGAIWAMYRSFPEDK